VLTVHLALRNISRNRLRSTIAIGAIGFGVVAILLAGGFVEWVFWAIREATIQTGLGHVHVERKGYRENGFADPFAYLLPAQSAELAMLEKAPGVKAVAPRLDVSGLASHGDTTLSFVGEGVDPAKDRLASPVLHIVQGAALDASDASGVTLGVGLAENLGVKPGDAIVLLSTGATRSLGGVDAHVRGIFRSEVKAYDDSAIRLPLDLARRLTKARGSHVWVVVLQDTDMTRQFVSQTAPALASANLEVVPWYDLADFYNKTVRLLSSQMVIVRVVIATIIVLGISNLLIMNVLERTGEIGTLMAMGTRRRRILAQFLWEGLLMGLVGAVLGEIVGAVLAALISLVGIPMPPPPGREAGYSAQILLTWRLAAGAFVLAVLTTSVAAIFPAWRGSRIAIVDALRYNR
jgi:putative ABC transport system permease protein